MKVLQNEPLAKYTSLNVGGKAENLIIAETSDELVQALKESSEKPWVLGYGCNVLISDKGLPGTTIVCRNNDISIEGNELIADAGAWWDDVVKESVARSLWGLEIMSEIPSSVGGAVYGNIAAYGQQSSDTLSWLEVFDLQSGELLKLNASDFDFSYRANSLQQQPHIVIIRAGFNLSPTPTQELQYDSALNIANELRLEKNNLEDRRHIIIETRRRAGSLYHYEDPNAEHTAGSFFKNPLVSTERARELASFDETGKTLERIENQSRIHGGDSHRASAAHVLLAAGYDRGQAWKNVRLHPSHVLKVETLPGATATEVFEVTEEILQAVKTKLDIDLEPEVKFLGEF